MTRMLLVVVVSMACTRSRSDPPAPAAATKTEPAPPEPPARSVLLSFAAFRKDSLAECNEFYVDGPPKPGSNLGAAGDAIWKTVVQPQIQKNATVTRLTKTCGEQFEDRKPYGACYGMKPAWANGDGGASLIRVDLYHFSFEAVFKSDWAMRECLQIGGDWKALSRESERFKRADLDHGLDTAQKNFDKAQQNTDRAMQLLR